MKDEQCKQEELKIKAAVGFRHVIDLLASEKKLIVGHNCFLGMNTTGLEIHVDFHFNTI